MRYLFHRIIRNDSGWRLPTPGRLGSTTDGKYLQDHGFGHEDWNFDKHVCQDGYVHGYAYYKPSNPAGRFCIVFATYDKVDGWAVAGYYRNAVFNEDGAVFSPALLKTRATELKILDKQASLGGKFRGKSVTKIGALLKQEAKHYRWCAKPNDVHVSQIPARLPATLTKKFGAYFTTATEIDEVQFKKIVDCSKNSATGSSSSSIDKTQEFPEGKKFQKLHTSRERNGKVPKLAKKLFKQKHGRLYCEVCGFDFHKKYGSAGFDYIEAHHQRYVSTLKPSEKTKLADIAMVCANCHRIIHRRRPWLTTAGLRKIIQ